VGVTGSNASHLEDARYYDDEDEMLQAALKASLEDAPVDFVVPEPVAKPITPEARGATSTSTPAPSASNQPPVASSAPKTTAKPEDESEDEEDGEEEEEEEASKTLDS
jgi:ataxin-3